MDLIVVSLLAVGAVGFIVCLFIMRHINKKIIKSAEELIVNANNFMSDISAMERDLTELRQQIIELSDTLYEMEDLEVDEVFETEKE